MDKQGLAGEKLGQQGRPHGRILSTDQSAGLTYGRRKSDLVSYLGLPLTLCHAPEISISGLARRRVAPSALPPVLAYKIGCKMVLMQGRYRWWHDQVLRKLAEASWPESKPQTTTSSQLKNTSSSSSGLERAQEAPVHRAFIDACHQEKIGK